ncbi:hypothetical protein BGX38DRAFT_1213362 [Terfezia claveryi]|nr:hypothetical protein BGX38DRAFT_1213362 [Terfezia claveryi]
MNVDAIVQHYHNPPAFSLPPTINGRIPSSVFIKERQAQLDHLVHVLGCLPLQHHIPGINLWLRIDPLEGGGFGFSLDLETVWGFVKHIARTRGNLIQSRESNDEKFVKWVKERVHLVPREEMKLLEFFCQEENQDREAAVKRGKLRRSGRTKTNTSGQGK